MIIVKGTIPVKPEHRDEAVSMVESLARASRGESGCLAYEVYLQASAPEVIMVWQQWIDMDALESHFASEHVDAFLDEIPDMIEGQVTSAHFEVDAHDFAADGEEQPDIPRIFMDGVVLH